MKELQLLLILIVTITVVHAFGKKNQMNVPVQAPVNPSQPVNIVNPGNNKTVPVINNYQLEKENQIRRMHQPSFYRYHRLKNKVDNNIAVLAKNVVINHFARVRPSHT